MTAECTRPELNDLLGPYVAGKLAAGDLEAVELHLLDCAACRAEVRDAVAVRRAGRKRRMTALWWAPLGTVAASIALLLFATNRNPYEKLGRLEEAPAFAGSPTRSAGAAAVAAVDSGMAAYTRGDYRQARTFLTRGSTLNQPGVHFYLGVTHLLTNQPDSALHHLGEARVPSDNPYAQEAEYYRAKAFLRLNQPDSALRALRAVGPQARVYAEATKLITAISER